MENDPKPHPHTSELFVENIEEEEKEEEEENFWPLSGKPYFHMVITKSHVAEKYRLTVPSSVYKHLPELPVPVVVTYDGKSWDMIYKEIGDKRKILNRDGWKEFVIDNELHIGDACVFEVVDSTEECINLKVQILRGDFPEELLQRAAGLTIENPLRVD